MSLISLRQGINVINELIPPCIYISQIVILYLPPRGEAGGGCHFFFHFPYTLIFATLISLRYLKIFSVWFPTAENSDFCKPLMINTLIFEAIS